MLDLRALPYFIKICGVTTVDDALAVQQLGASALGLIMAPSSRQITLAQARAIAQATEGSLLRTAVFRNDSDEFIIEVVDATGVDLVQIHGPLRDGVLDQLRTRGVSIIKALSVDDADFACFDDASVDAVLVDGPSPGSGKSHSWSALRQRQFAVPVIIAGGLDPSNVAGLIDELSPWGVDVATGVESAPGVKDVALVTSFVERARHSFVRGEE